MKRIVAKVGIILALIALSLVFSSGAALAAPVPVHSVTPHSYNCGWQSLVSVGDSDARVTTWENTCNSSYYCSLSSVNNYGGWGTVAIYSNYGTMEEQVSGYINPSVTIHTDTYVIGPGATYYYCSGSHD